MRARRRVAESKPTGVGENRRVERGRDRLRELQPDDRREVEDELAGGAGGRVREHHVPGRFVGRDVVVDDEARNVELAHGVGQGTQPLHIAHVEHDERVERRQRRRALRCVIDEVIAQEKRKRGRPRRRIDDAGLDPKLAEQSGETGNGATCVAIGVHVRRQNDSLAGMQLGDESLDCSLSMSGWLEEIRWLHDRQSGESESGALSGRRH